MPSVSSAVPFRPPTAHFPTGGTAASRPATAIAPAADPSLSPGAPLHPALLTTPSRARYPPPCDKKSAGFFAAVDRLASCTLFSALYHKRFSCKSSKPLATLSPSIAVPSQPPISYSPAVQPLFPRILNMCKFGEPFQLGQAKSDPSTFHHLTFPQSHFHRVL